MPFYEFPSTICKFSLFLAVGTREARVMPTARRATTWATPTLRPKTARSSRSARFSDKRLPSLWKLVKSRRPTRSPWRRRCGGRTARRTAPSAPRSPSSAKRRTKRQSTARCKYENNRIPQRSWSSFWIGRWSSPSARELVFSQNFKELINIKLQSRSYWFMLFIFPWVSVTSRTEQTRYNIFNRHRYAYLMHDSLEL